MRAIPGGVIASLIISIAICAALPAGGLIVAQKRYQKASKPFFLGMLAFFLSQIVLRLPALQLLLPRFGWYTAMASRHVFLYAAFLALTAGLFEETARFLILKRFFRRGLRFGDGIAMGLGHGGLEAVLITALPLVNSLLYALAINEGTFDALMIGVPQAQRDGIAISLYNLTGFTALLGGAERIFAVCIHTGMTMLAASGLQRRRPLWGLLAAIAAHTFVNAVCAMLPLLGAGALAIEGACAVFAALAVTYTLWAKRHINWRKGEIAS